MSSDPLNDALREATLAVLLGSTTVPHQIVMDGGGLGYGTITIGSAFAERIRSKAFAGDFDGLIRQAMTQVDAAAVARAIEGLLAKEILAGLARTDRFGGRSEPNWLQERAKSIAVEACTTALSADEALLDTLRQRIGVEVDRNRVGITVNLSDPEAAS